MTSADAMDPALHMLAQRAGILTRWTDAAGQPQRVSEPVLRSLLDAMGLACMTPSRISDSLHLLEQDQQVHDGGMVVVQAGCIPRLRCDAAGRWRLALESGDVMTGVLQADRPGWVCMKAVSEPGYHTLMLEHMTLTLAVVPPSCPALKQAPGRERPWGLVAQIYSLPEQRASHDVHPVQSAGPGHHPETGHSALPGWMQGRHFGAVGKLAVHAASEGASALALSPAHAMFSADPQRYSPYSPSSRLFMNVLYGDPAQVLGDSVIRHVLSTWDQGDVQGVPDISRLPDWPRIAGLRLRLLRDLFAHFCLHGPAHLIQKFEAFRQALGPALQHHSTYEALHAHHVSRLGRGHGWQDWSSDLQQPGGAAVARFAHEHDADIEFHAFAQWLVFESAQQAQEQARAAGMTCGLISDLAIGTDPRGSHAWSLQNEILNRVSVGAPPDVYQKQGQNWGLTAFSPRGLRSGAYRAFIDTLRASLHSAGGIRIDHVAGMERLWLIPEGASAAEGAYLAYPRHELLGLIALEATRHHAIVIGENLGTVSDELNRSIREHGVLGTRVLWFERDTSRAPVSVAPFRSANHWPADAVAMPTTHDLPTVHGWWQERDIHWKLLLGQLTRADHAVVQAERGLQRADLWRALQQEGCAPDVIRMPPDETPLSAILSFVARTPAPLALFPLEDILGVSDQPNMPGGDSETRLIVHPNWVQQLPASVNHIFDDGAVAGRVRAVRHARSQPCR